MKWKSSISPLVKEIELRKSPVIVRVNKFDEESAKEFDSQISHAHNTGQEIIPIIIDSYGGQVYSLMSMISSIKSSSLPIATIVEGKKVSVDSMIVPGSGLVKEQAESEGLDKIFIDAGFDWREPGCSMCLAMNPDQLKPKERCASTSNRNFEGRQGREGRTHLVSPVVAAASAIKGTFAQESDL